MIAYFFRSVDVSGSNFLRIRTFLVKAVPGPNSVPDAMERVIHQTTDTNSIITTCKIMSANNGHPVNCFYA